MAKINFIPIEEPLNEMTTEEIMVRSTSNSTSDVSPIILKCTEQLKFSFNPVLVDNPNNPEHSVSGKLVLEKKRKKDDTYPSEKTSRRSIKVGDFLELQMKTSETFNLYQGLKLLYELKSNIGETAYGTGTYTKIDASFIAFKELIENDPSTSRLLSNPENYELVKILLQLITNSESHQSLREGLQSLNPDNINNLSTAINTERLKRSALEISDNLNNSSEEFWQTLFSQNQWILSQIFSLPYTIFGEKSYVGGKGINNKGGNICDFIYQNELTQNVTINEIKTPTENLIGEPYRNTYTLSSELSGTVNQVLNYKDSLIKKYSELTSCSEHFEVFDPKCIVIIGCIQELSIKQIGTLERYRNALSNVLIITFDELLQKINDTISLFENGDISNAEHNDLTESDFNSLDELPF